MKLSHPSFFCVVNGNQSPFTSKIVGRAEILLVLVVLKKKKKKNFYIIVSAKCWQSNTAAKFYYCEQF